jgi:DivIVA domain-containing protein
MPDTDRRQRVISSTPRMTPDEIASRTFGSKVKGLSEPEVRAFLRRVADEVRAGREREEELVATLDELEQQLRAPRPLDEQQLLDALGEETARLLRSAREAAEDIRTKADERAAAVMEEAQTEAHRLRTEAAEILGTRTAEAEEHVADIIADGEARAKATRDENERLAEEQRLRAENEASAIIEAARQQGRDMLDEARVARERVLSDLGRRRALLQGQVEELRQGRDRLLDAYRVVKRTFLDATEALAHVEQRAASERPVTPVDTGEIAVVEGDTAPVDAPVTEAADTVPEAATEIPGPAVAAVAEPAAGAAPAPTAVEEIVDEPRSMADVDSLFARLRAGHDEVQATADGDPETTPAPAPDAEVDIVVEVEVEVVEVTLEEAGDTVPAAAADAWRATHASGVEALAHPLLKRAKRAAQDDQNALLDAVRRHKGRPSAAQVLRDDETLTASWTAVLHDALGDAYRAGRVAAGDENATAAVPESLLREASESNARPLRERLAVAIDDVDEGDTSGLVERIGARYREWKNQQLDETLGDVIVVAWSRGVYDATPDGSVMQWIPLVEGRCSDCDDNALEPTAKGNSFPTGQAHPPAHPGCRCLLAPADVLATVTAS